MSSACKRRARNSAQQRKQDDLEHSQQETVYKVFMLNVSISAIGTELLSQLSAASAGNPRAVNDIAEIDAKLHHLTQLSTIKQRDIDSNIKILRSELRDANVVTPIIQRLGLALCDAELIVHT